MPGTEAELRNWHDWTDPDFLAEHRHTERRFLPLFLRQIFPGRTRRTKLTLIGWLLVVVAMGIGSAAYNTASNILFMTLSLLLGSLILSGILSAVNFRKLDWRVHAPPHLRVGEVGAVEVALHNGKRLFPSMGLRFRMESSADGAGDWLYLRHSVAAGGRLGLEWTFVPRRRGRCEVRMSAVDSHFPFGFLRKSMRTTETAEVIVWPARVPYSFRPLEGGWRTRHGSPRRVAGVGSDLLNLRKYERGDPPRLIHWKASARAGQLMIRQLAQEGERGFHIQVDGGDGWPDGAFETMCSVACSLADDLFHAGRLESAAVGGGMRYVRGTRDLHEFFDELALLEPGGARGASPGGAPCNRITFRPAGGEKVALHVDGNKAGETDS